MPSCAPRDLMLAQKEVVVEAWDVSEMHNETPHTLWSQVALGARMPTNWLWSASVRDCIRDARDSIGND